MHIAEGFVRPRSSVRRVIDAGQGIDTVVAMVLMAYLVQAIAAVAMPGGRPETSQSALLWHVVNLFSHFLVFFAVAGLAYWIGRAFGGSGRMDQTLVAIGWHWLVTSFLAPLALIGWAEVMAGEPSAFGPLLLIATSVIFLWILSAFLAELHGFRSIWAVLGVTLGLMLVMSLLLMSLVRPG